MKLWGGRFVKDTDKLVEDFHSSISFDRRLYRQDIEGSIAHVRMLGKQGIVAENEVELIEKGLKEIKKELEEGSVSLEVETEDIHMNIEKLLIEKIGDVGKKLHTGRSRNDQIALDLRMYLREEADNISGLLIELQRAVVEKAEKNLDTVMPGYTHMQKAQPILFAHHLLAYFEMFQRDLERMMECRERIDVMPLGSGALAGTTFSIDREAVKQELDFENITRNSIDAVSDRDFVIEFSFVLSLIMMHLSRFCEELVIWSTEEFGFVEVDDAYGTGSSIMPQKKNPDVAELIRGKSGRVYGDLISLLTVMKSLPLAYNKDMQEDKETVFDAVDTAKGCLIVFTPMITTLKINSEKMRREARGGYTNATDAADYLVRKGLPFREAHKIVGQLVLYCMEKNTAIDSLSLEEFKKISPQFEEDIFEFVSIDSCVSRRDVAGATGNRQVRQAVKDSYDIIDGNINKLEKRFSKNNSR